MNESLSDDCIFSNVEEINKMADKYRGLAVTIAQSLNTHIPIQDLVQEANICLYSVLRKVNNEKSITTFIQRSIRNHLLRVLKKENRPCKYFKEYSQYVEINSDCNLEKEDTLVILNSRKKYIQQCLNVFPDNYKQIVIKYYGLNNIQRKSMLELSKEYNVSIMAIAFKLNKFKEISYKIINDKLSIKDKKFLNRINKISNKQTYIKKKLRSI